MLTDDASIIEAARSEGRPVVTDDATGVTAIGPSLELTAQAPDLTLPDLDGNAFSLSSLRGQKVLVLAWAPY